MRESWTADAPLRILTAMTDVKQDTVAAHGLFAARCFNRAWKGIDAAERSPEEEEQMLSAAHASFWHWTQHPKCTPQNYSVGYWQLSRVYSLLGATALAQRYAQRALQVALDAPLPPYFVGCAYEALARAARVGGDRAAMAEHLSHAREWALRVESDDSRRLLQAELDSLG